jgi:sugar phosphate isomerase/epimerase
VEVIEAIGSANLRATIDVGNYMQCGQEGHVGTAVAAAHAGYVHFKDFRKVDDASVAWGWGIGPCTVGDGDVDHAACLRALRDARYEGAVAIEYEGTEDELTGVPRSVAFTRRVIEEVS